MIKLRVKEVLREKGITQKELAERLGITEVGLSKSLGESGNPSLSTLSKIAVVLEVDFTELFKAEKDTITCPNCGKRFKMEE